VSAVLTEDPDPTPAGAAAAAPELFIVMNRGSGKEAKDAVRETVEAELDRAGRRYRFIPVEPGQIVQACQQAARLAREHGGIIVAAGGDGTMNCAAQAALGQGCPLGVIAQGTFNLFARQHGLPLEAAAAVQALLQARPEPVQVGLVNQRVFLVNGSVGLYPKLLADREQVKQKYGRRRWIAMLAALKSLLEWRLQLSLDAELDGQLSRLRTASLFVCNNALQLERVGIEPELVAQVGEGRLAAVLARPMGLFAKLGLLVHALAGSLAEAQAIDSFTVRTLGVTTRHARRLKVATDGEVTWMELPLRFTVSPRPLQLMLPPPEQRLPVR
jgi:diacylglycerol kinase family enzyme